MMRKTASLLLVSAALGGCASMNQLSSDVSSYSRWPAERKPASYAFERLPSQESRPETQELLENAARGAIEAAGFKIATDPTAAEYVVQLGARIDVEGFYVGDPFWGRGGFYGGPYGFYGPYGYGRYGRGYWGPGFWGPGYWGSGYYGSSMTIYQREVAVLIRDRRSGTPLYEARATSDGSSSAIEALLPAMFQAALKDFPNGGVNPRRVTIQLIKQ